MITRIKFVGVYVRDQARALDFFTNKLGFEVLQDEAFGEGLRWIEVAPPGAETGLSLFTPPGMEERIGTFSPVVFTCADVRATYAELLARGVTFTQAPKDEAWGVSAMFIDPDGNTYLLGTSET
ncbi:MAG TPA: VOC family protein [Pyrinomonadaceae bacterium]|jgi:catechol 2,3-dioxygenase-like lactoylglutathione lyase family enzyme